MSAVQRVVGVVCGLKSEAATVEKAAGGLNFCVGVSGARAAEARAIARRFADQGASALLSVGVSGGLDTKLRPGDVVIGDQVISDIARPSGGRSRAANSCLLGLAQEAAVNAICGPVYGSDAIVQTTEEKARLHAATGALAVDMESHAVAEIAAERDLPFLAIRAIADPAERALPPPAMDAVAPDGSTRVVATLVKAALAPHHFPALIRLGGDSKAALSALERVLPNVLKGVDPRAARG